MHNILPYYVYLLFHSPPPPQPECKHVEGWNFVSVFFIDVSQSSKTMPDTVGTQWILWNEWMMMLLCSANTNSWHKIVAE